MVVGHDISVLADDDSGPAALALTAAAASHAVTEEETEERIDVLLLRSLGGHLHIDYGLDRILCRICKIRIIRE